MKYEVTGFIAIKMVVTAESEDEAIELANESFDKDKHIDSEAEPDFQVANNLEASSEDDDDDSPLRNKRAMRSLDEEDDD